MTTGMFRVDAFLFKRTVASSPFSSGKLRSIMIRSGCRLEALSMASAPVAASKTSWPNPLINPPRVSRQASLLSTINIFLVLFAIQKGVEAQGMPARAKAAVLVFVAAKLPS